MMWNWKDYDFLVPPTAVWVEPKAPHLSAGRAVEFVCRSAGAAPAARYTWLMQGGGSGGGGFENSSKTEEITQTGSIILGQREVRYGYLKIYYNFN